MIIIKYKLLRNEIETEGQIEIADEELKGLNEQEQFEEKYTWILFKEKKWDRLEMLEELHVPGNGGLRSETLYSKKIEN
ncbi:hypothetical protein YDYSY3_39320 [Paenibacillus chitinolyticus]|uniref:hypothetical protein n=1 Tax=Paenibacillus chitinolyticus TaxID=79263 RepID=UPI0026E4A5A1|nr:hypothetical protein [Paenibacillus chitinolyticus]GKS12932.1 hypothetical protein YDYSY3_39320 [Paenibacillus chitinolyticus]